MSVVLAGEPEPRPCKHCKQIDILDGERNICYSCWQLLDMEDLD